MLANCIISFLLSALISLILCFLGALIIIIFQEENLAKEFIISWIFEFNGVLVGGAGLGLLLFIKKNSKLILNRLINIVDIPIETSPKIVAINKNLSSFYKINLFCVPLIIIGGYVLLNSGYPLKGFAQ